jgi:hypothetical protein
MRARCDIMPGLCSVGWRLVSITSPSRRCRYTILPPPTGGTDPPASFAPDPAVDAADRDSSVFATASLRCDATAPSAVNHEWSSVSQEMVTDSYTNP